MINRSARTAVALLTSCLLLSACGADGADRGTRARPAPSPTPLFAEPAARQPQLAVEATQHSRTAAFRQTITFGSRRGAATQTTQGFLDFGGDRARAARVWNVPPSLPDNAGETFLGKLLHGRARVSVQEAYVDRATVAVQPGRADYWLRFTTAVSDSTGANAISELRGIVAPFGGTLLEAVAGARSVTARPAPGGGRVYTMRLGLKAVADVVPGFLHAELREVPKEYTTDAPVPMTLTVDARGRITRADADLTVLLGRKGSALAWTTSLKASLVLTGHGSSTPPALSAGERVLDAATAYARLADVRPGSCADLDSGTHQWDWVVIVPCGTSHDARIYAQLKLGGDYPGDGAVREGIDDACREARAKAPEAWAGSAGAMYGHVSPPASSWEVEKGATTCYAIEP
ncbi:hypothetical protein ABT160_07575 [Streptomyces sp. NPDC001941]|uniref:hypothetical protein n=1 Tax=Streptomyces sp. NPDC001941 TaxID=3154659 RepID=UPI00331BEC6A